MSSSSQPVPKRRPLHERSDSQTNRRSTPSIRLVEDSHVYQADPFPSQPSHVLSPSAESSTVSGHDPFVSRHGIIDPPPLPSEPRLPVKYHRRRSSSRSTRVPEPAVTLEDARIWNDDATREDTPTAHRVRQTKYDRQTTNRRPSAGLLPDELVTTLDVSGTSRPGYAGRPPPWPPFRLAHPAAGSRMSTIGQSEKGPQSVVPTYVPGLHVGPTTGSSHTSAQARALPWTPATESPSGQMRASRNGRRPSVSYSAFPSVQPPNNPPKYLPPAIPYPVRPAGPRSINAPTLSRLHSRPSPARQVVPVPAETVATESSAVFQYPAVKPPSSQSSWVNSTIITPERIRMDEGQLVPGEDMLQPPGILPSAGETVKSLQVVDDDKVDVPDPLAQWRSASSARLVGVALTSGVDERWPQDTSEHSEDRNSTTRVVSGAQTQGNDKGDAQRQSTTRGSTVLDGRIETKRRQTKDKQTETAIRDSVTLGAFPAWARTYYSRGARESTFDVLQAAAERGNNSPNVPMNDQQFGISNNDQGYPSTETSLLRTDPSVERRDARAQRTGLRRPVTVVWSPHLQQDRSAKTLSIWKAPQVEERAADGLMSRRRLQIGMFCLGFIFPFAWMIAAFLPLPLNPRASSSSSSSSSSSAVGSTAAQDAFEKNVHPIDLLRYDSARWWRNLNRAMSLLGFLIIGAIIALAVIATMRK